MTDATQTTKGETMTRLEREFTRVFGSCHVDEDGAIFADGWPDAIQYDESGAADVLATFANGHGATDNGDAEVCGALEAAGVVVAD